MRLAQIGAVAALLVAVAAVAGFARPGSAHGSAAQESNGITVSGTAKVKAVPDDAAFTFGVETAAPTAREATAANARQMRKVVAALLAAGVGRSDLQTQDVSVGPNWDGGNRPHGFAAHNAVTATVHGVSHAGAVADAAVAAGATETSGPSFDRSDREQLYRTALRDALENARMKAQALAAEAGSSLGRVLKIEETAAQQPIPMYARAAESAGTTTPVEPGTEEIEASLTVTFALA